MIEILFFIIGATLLYISSNMIIKAINILSEKTGLSQAFLGFIFIALLTSLPELFTLTESVILKVQSIGLGTITGSVLINFFIVLAIASFFNEIKVSKDDKKQLVYHLLLILLFFILCLDQEISKVDGIILTLFYLLTNLNLFFSKKKSEQIEFSKIAKAGAILALSAFILVPSSFLLVNYGNAITSKFSFNRYSFGLFITALLTSLPELLTAIISSKSKYKYVFGDVIGSNMINLSLVIAIPTLIGNIEVSKLAIKNIFTIFISSLIASVIIIYNKKVSKKVGLLLLLLYIIISFFSH